MQSAGGGSDSSQLRSVFQHATVPCIVPVRTWAAVESTAALPLIDGIASVVGGPLARSHTEPHQPRLSA
jgi:hypothetical protein